MNYDELSFFNQQLAAMLKSGLPLEGSLRQIADGMRTGPLRSEIEQLERDLRQGTPVQQALARRQFPDMYKALVTVGLKSNDLPAVLTMLADYYRAADSNWTRLKGLMVYPALVLAASLVVSCLLAFLFMHIVGETSEAFGGVMPGMPGPPDIVLFISVWLPVIVLGLVALAGVFAVSRPAARHWLRWRLPGFREASLVQLASALALMTENGCDAKSAFQVIESSEPNPAVRGEFRAWHERLAGGASRFVDVARGKIVPPLFVWLVASAGENWGAGFRRAAEVYGARASYRIELALYAALPVSILIVTALVGTELAPIMAVFARFMNALGGDFSGE